MGDTSVGFQGVVHACCWTYGSQATVGRIPGRVWHARRDPAGIVVTDGSEHAGRAPERRSLAMTEEPVRLAIRPIADERVPEGLTGLAAYLGDRVIARAAVDPELPAFIARHRLFDQPVPLALAAVIEPPGLQCRLFAIVALSPEATAELEQGDDDEEEETPWAASVPGAGYEEAAHAEERASGEGRQAAFFLGQIVRFDRDRRYPDDLVKETVDVLSQIVQGEVTEVVDKILDQLLP